MLEINRCNHSTDIPVLYDVIDVSCDVYQCGLAVSAFVICLLSFSYIRAALLTEGNRCETIRSTVQRTKTVLHTCWAFSLFTRRIHVSRLIDRRTTFKIKGTVRFNRRIPFFDNCLPVFYDIVDLKVGRYLSSET